MLTDPKIGMSVRTLITTYGSLQKQQVANLTKIPAGTEGKIRAIGIDSDNAIWMLTIFRINNKRLFAKLGPTTIEGTTHEVD